MAQVLPLQMSESQNRKAWIQAEGLTVRLGSTVIIEDACFTVYKGEFVSLVGLSGSGKTTMLNALAGFIPSTGRVHIPGRIGVVFQDYSVFPWMTVSENIAFGLHDLPMQQRTQIVSRLLEMVRLTDRAGLYPAQLSGGQAQRVGIARALAPDPDVIFMDEPYASLDRFTREDMQRWLLDVWGERQKTIVFVTHDIEEAIFLSDRIAVLHDRRIKATVEIPFSRPRREDLKYSKEFLEVKLKILEKMRGAADMKDKRNSALHRPADERD